MTSQSINSPVITGKFADIIDFLTVDGDEIDALAQQALQIIICTDQPQTGEEAYTDQFVANMYASAALSSLNEIKRYPFLRPKQEPLDLFVSGSMHGSQLDIIGSAQQMIEAAEALLPPIPDVPSFFDVSTAGGTDLVAARALVAEILNTSDPQLDALIFIIVGDDEPATAE